ncbi:MAG: acetylglutamate kinase [Lachnospiraceae bacterium]|nr:acetylglutamate kinase [Lachnospiraceae bacterium]
MKTDELTNRNRAEVLVQALPFIQRYNGRTIVIKYGGNAMTSEVLKEQVMEDIVLLTMVGVKVVVVHGGGPEISSLMKRLGKVPQFIDGLRVTDQETVDIAEMVLAGKVNKSLVSLLQTKGGRAIGVSGMDGRLIEAKLKDPRYGYVGDVTRINPQMITDMLDDGYIPVVSTLGWDKEGHIYNINGDTAAGAIAAAIGAERMIMMTDISGIMRDKDDPDSLIQELTVSEAQALCQNGVVQGGMIPKVECCIDALEHGVKAVVIIDGRVPHALLMEILTNEGAGTMIRSSGSC